MLGQSVCWANPDIITSNTLQIETLFTRPDREDSVLFLVTGYLGFLLQKIEDIPELREISRITEELNTRITRIKNSKNISSKVKEALPAEIKLNVSQYSAIIDMGEYKLRYFNHRIFGGDLSGMEGLRLTHNVIDTRIGKYLTRQILIRKKPESLPVPENIALCSELEKQGYHTVLIDAAERKEQDFADQVTDVVNFVGGILAKDGLSETSDVDKLFAVNALISNLTKNILYKGGKGALGVKVIKRSMAEIIVKIACRDFSEVKSNKDFNREITGRFINAERMRPKTFLVNGDEVTIEALGKTWQREKGTKKPVFEFTKNSPVKKGMRVSCTVYFNEAVKSALYDIFTLLKSERRRRNTFVTREDLQEKTKGRVLEAGLSADSTGKMADILVALGIVEKRENKNTGKAEYKFKYESSAGSKFNDIISSFVVKVAGQLAKNGIKKQIEFAKRELDLRLSVIGNPAKSQFIDLFLKGHKKFVDIDNIKLLFGKMEEFSDLNNGNGKNDLHDWKLIADVTSEDEPDIAKLRQLEENIFSLFLSSRLKGDIEYIEFLKDHTLRTADLAEKIARIGGYSNEEVALFRILAIAHDVGKALEQGKLELHYSKHIKDAMSEDDKVRIHDHSLDGFIVLKEAGIKLSPEVVLAIIINHRQDQKELLKAVNPALWKKIDIFSSVDEFCALVEPRSYKRDIKMSKDKHIDDWMARKFDKRFWSKEKLRPIRELLVAIALRLKERSLPQRLKFCLYSELPVKYKTNDLYELVRNMHLEFSIETPRGLSDLRKRCDAQWKKTRKGEYSDAMIAFDGAMPIAIQRFILSPKEKTSWDGTTYVDVHSRIKGGGGVLRDVFFDYLKQEGIETVVIGDASRSVAMRDTIAAQSFQESFIRDNPETIKKIVRTDNETIESIKISLKKYKPENRYTNKRRLTKKNINKTMKGPGTLSLDEDDRVDHEHIESLITKAKERKDANISEAAGYVMKHAPPLKGAKIDPAKISLYTVDSPGDQLGIPRFRGAEKASDLIYAHVEYDKTEGMLKIYVTKKYFEEHLKNNKLALAEIIDHEFTENVLGLSHRVAASRSHKFVPEGGFLSPFHHFYINRMINENNYELARSLILERKGIGEDPRTKNEIAAITRYEKTFFSYLLLLEWLKKADIEREHNVLAEYSLRVYKILDRHPEIILTVGQKEVYEKIRDERLYLLDLEKAEKVTAVLSNFDFDELKNYDENTVFPGNKLNSSVELRCKGKKTPLIRITAHPDKEVACSFKNGDLYRIWILDKEDKVIDFRQMGQIYEADGKTLRRKFNFKIPSKEFSELGDCVIKGHRLNSDGVLGLGGRTAKFGGYYAMCKTEIKVKSGKIEFVKILDEYGHLIKRADFVMIHGSGNKLVDSFYHNMSKPRLRKLTNAGLTKITLKKFRLNLSGGLYLQLLKDPTPYFHSLPSAEVEVDLIRSSDADHWHIDRVRILDDQGQVVDEVIFKLVYDNKGVLICSFNDQIFEKDFKKLTGTITRLKTKESGNVKAGTVSLGRFGRENKNRPIEVEIERDIPIRANFVKNIKTRKVVGKPIKFSLIYDGNGKLADSFLGSYSVEKRKALKKATVKEFNLTENGYLKFGGKYWAGFTQYKNRKVEFDVVDGVVTEVRIFDKAGTKIEKPFILSLVYEVKRGNKEKLVDSFWEAYGAPDFGELRDHVIKKVKLARDGDLEIGGRVGRTGNMPRATFPDNGGEECIVYVKYGEVVRVTDLNGTELEGTYYSKNFMGRKNMRIAKLDVYWKKMWKDYLSEDKAPARKIQKEIIDGSVKQGTKPSKDPVGEKRRRMKAYDEEQAMHDRLFKAILNEASHPEKWTRLIKESWEEEFVDRISSLTVDVLADKFLECFDILKTGDVGRKDLRRIVSINHGAVGTNAVSFASIYGNLLMQDPNTENTKKALWILREWIYRHWDDSLKVRSYKVMKYDEVDLDEAIKKIEKNAEKVIPRIAQDMMKASGDIERANKAKAKEEDKEKVIIYLDEDLASLTGKKLKKAMGGIIDQFTGVKMNNKEIKRFSEEVEIRQGKPSEYLAKKGKVKDENFIVVTTKGNLRHYSALEGRSVVVALDDANGKFPETAYLPVLEVTCFAIGKYMATRFKDWDEATLREYYRYIPNVVYADSLDGADLNERYWKDLFSRDVKEMVIKLIPDAERLDVDKHVEMLGRLRAFLKQA